MNRRKLLFWMLPAACAGGYYYRISTLVGSTPTRKQIVAVLEHDIQSAVNVLTPGSAPEREVVVVGARGAGGDAEQPQVRTRRHAELANDHADGK